MGRAYLAAHPSRGFSVRSFGHALAEFLRRASPWSERPALADMAMFEAALADAFDAADAEPIAIDDLMHLPPPAWPTLTLHFHPSARLLTLRTRAPEAWAAQNDGRAFEEPPLRPGDWLVWRQGLDLKYRSLDADETAALRSAVAGEDFSALCEALAEHGPEDRAAFRAAGLTRLWIEAGLIAGMHHQGRLSG
jgi:hypothetical protein